jgi:hypothetical protein
MFFLVCGLVVLRSGVSRPAKNPKDKAAEQASVKTSFWRQVGKEMRGPTQQEADTLQA